ncbi:30s ribosomal protein s15 [Nannochloropsis gaditana]|uniref:30s ribosomal protein s15 n=1 Tax=Nannochloropsis gaditana TaxID=72520 RepID=W7TFG4_9STRA|nr:30s ribosomal protein s15 [Nannochloropsis gaditana]
MWRQQLASLARLPSSSISSCKNGPTNRLLASSAASSEPLSPPSKSPSYKYLIPGSLLQDAPNPVQRALSIENADAPERKQAEKQEFIEKFGVRPGDTGSTSVQVACLTVRIKHVKDHCNANKQDKAARRGYTALLTRRRTLMKYLRRKDFASYQNVIKELGLTGFT